jgi:hypothetical protein
VGKCDADNPAAHELPDRLWSGVFTTPCVEGVDVGILESDEDRGAFAGRSSWITLIPFLALFRDDGRPQLDGLQHDGPRPVQNRIFQMRVTLDFLRSLDALRKLQSDHPSRTEMIRRLVEKAIASIASGN